MTTQVRNSEMVNLLRGDYQARYEPQFALSNYMATVLALTGLRGFWPMSAFDASGNAIDTSANIHTLGAGTGRTLTYNGNPTYNYDDLAPYLDFDGTGDYLARADEAGLDILGTETYVANPGLTLGGWFWLDTLPSAFSGFLSKSVATGNQRSYGVILLATNVFRFFISTDGINSDTVDGATATTDQWYFLVGRFNPSTEVALFVNGTKTTNTTSISASIFNSTSAFEVFRINASPVMDGRASLCFLCASYLSDAIIGNLFQQSRALFGV